MERNTNSNVFFDKSNEVLTYSGCKDGVASNAIQSLLIMTSIIRVGQSKVVKAQIDEHPTGNERTDLVEQEK